MGNHNCVQNNLSVIASLSENMSFTQWREGAVYSLFRFENFSRMKLILLLTEVSQTYFNSRSPGRR